MKCRICGRECPSAAKICRDCASARKRAFAATVTLPLLAAVGAPSLSEPRFAPKPARRRAANDPAVVHAPAPVAPPVAVAAALPLNVVPRKPGAIWLLVAVVAAVILLLIVLRTIESPQRSDAAATTDAPAVQVLALPSLPAQSETVPASVPTEAPEKIIPGKVHRKSAARLEDATPVPMPVTSMPEPAPVAPVPPPRVVESSRPDPWQLLNEGLSGCARQGLLDRMACEQRLRSQYCGNSWGLVPQCPIGPSTDHGQ
jgi:hypothetical protein